jgi:hypothetical protein
VGFFLLAIALSVPRYTASDYPFGIFKLFFHKYPDKRVGLEQSRLHHHFIIKVKGYSYLFTMSIHDKG